MAWITEAAEIAENGVGTGRWRLVVWSDEDGGGPFGDSTHDHATAAEAHDCERCQEFCDRSSGFPMRKYERLFTTGRVLQQVAAERRRQDKKWGEQNHDPTLYLTILGEQFGEACRAALELRVGKWPESRLRKELLEVAAVAVAAVECLDRRKWAWGSHAVPATAAPPGQGGGGGVMGRLRLTNSQWLVLDEALSALLTFDEAAKERALVGLALAGEFGLDLFRCNRCDGRATHSDGEGGFACEECLPHLEADYDPAAWVVLLERISYSQLVEMRAAERRETLVAARPASSEPEPATP